MTKMMIELEQIAQGNIKINPAAVRTPQGYRRIKRGEQLCEGDLFLHCNLLEWCPVYLFLRENYFTNCIRPIRLLAEHCS